MNRTIIHYTTAPSPRYHLEYNASSIWALGTTGSLSVSDNNSFKSLVGVSNKRTSTILIRFNRKFARSSKRLTQHAFITFVKFWKRIHNDRTNRPEWNSRRARDLIYNERQLFNGAEVEVWTVQKGVKREYIKKNSNDHGNAQWKIRETRDSSH